MNPEITDAEKSDPQLKSANHPKFSLLIASLIFIFIALTATLIIPLIRAQILSAKKSESINNAKQIGLALFAFEDEYGTFPNDITAKDIIENHPSYQQDLSGTSSNSLMRQLILNSENGRSELMFKFTDYDIPDGNIEPGEILKKGEINFAYISDPSAAGNPSRAIILAPLIPGTKKFDAKPFDGSAIVLRIDNSAGIYKIHEDGHVYDKDGNILSPEHPIWNGKTPDIHYPE